MSDAAVRGIVIGHGDVAAGLVDAVAQIAGSPEGALVPLSNRGLSPDAVSERVQEISTGHPTIVFTDLPSGSCCVAARRVGHGRSDMVVITGVNLPMLLDFVTHRDLPLPELVQRVLARGQAGISSSPATVESHAHPALSRG